ncbi:MAG: FAD-binding protein [Bacteroidia bacterium]|nr:FAD-binding protein [Bacteroidia bacterium]
MKNWAENIHWNPSETAYPETEEQVADLVMRARKNGKHIRAIGSGHSFTALCATDQLSLSLDRMQQTSPAPEENRAWAQGGTKLKKLGADLFAMGLSQENLGDINVQSISGATATGTHGTGISFGNISTQIEEITFVNGKGEIITCNAADEALFNSIRISLGSMGIITRIKLRCVPAYNLHLEKKKERLGDVLNKLETYIHENRNFEFYWLPYTPYTQTKYSNAVTTAATHTPGWKAWVDEVLLENHVFGLFCGVAKTFPSTAPAVSRLTAAFIGKETKVKEAHNVFATQRLVKFTEMEYNVPLAQYKDVMKELTARFGREKYPINFPIENRFVKEDEMYLSPAHKRNSAYIACHAYKGVDNTRYFRDMEAIFQAHGGRPHWGKMHTCTSAYLRNAYPQWDAFHTQRAAQDPDGVFLSPYLRKIFGL